MFGSGIFDKGVVIPKEDKIPFAFCVFANLDFLFPQIEHLDFNFSLPFLVFTILELTLSVFYLQTKQ